MITMRTLADFITAEPFRPFRIQMASGRTFEIRHPEMIEVGKSKVTVYSSLDDSSGAPEQWHKLSMLLIERVEPIQTAAK